MKVLVTGIAGFIASHLAEQLLKRGDTVVGIDNFDPYYDPRIKRKNAEILGGYPLCTIHARDLRERDFVHSLIQKERFDAIAHLGALAGVRNAVEHPGLYLEVDYTATHYILEAAKLANKPHIVFASTSSVYGATTQIPFVETDPCDRPLQPYAAAKRAAEMLGFTYYHLFKQSFTAVRFFTVYGPRGRPDMMAYLLADSIRTGREIPLYEGGQMYRDWTFIGDIVDGITRALDQPLGYEVLNFGRGEPVLLSDFVTALETIANKKANLVNAPKLAADVGKTFADISKANRLIGYSPRVSVSEGISAFWQWYSSQEHQ